MDDRNLVDNTDLINAEETDEILRKYDKESNIRILQGFSSKAVKWIAIAWSIFQLYTAIFGILPSQLQRSIHLIFAFTLAYLVYPRKKTDYKKGIPVYDIVLSVLGAAVGGYWVIEYNDLLYRAGEPTSLDILVGALAIVILIEAARRASGFPIITIAVVFLLYTYFGPYMPSFLQHRGFSLERIIYHMYFTTEGIIGIPTGVSATFVFLFILFGAFLEKTGVGQFIIDFANAIAGRATAGPAKVAVVASALMGTISGSSVANTVGTGSFTIPMMKRMGYRPEFAGAVEAAASTGGQIMPPIMGAAAFLMAEFTGIPYGKIIISAAIPAMLYFTGIFVGAHLEGKRNNLRGMSADEVPNLWDVLKSRGHLMLPIVAIVYFLVQGMTPTKAAVAGIGAAIAVSCIKKETRLSVKDILDALENGAKAALGLSIVAATAGIIVGTVTLTGLGLKMANGIVALSGGNLVLTMILTMFASLILGMGIPTTANYIITSTIAAPALLKLGVPMIVSHFFVFYFGIIADLTPPVCVAAFAGAGIAKADPIKTGINATKLAIAAWIIPYVFVLSPALLLVDTTFTGAVLIVVTALLGMTAVSASVHGYLFTKTNVIERVLMLIAGLGMIVPGILTDIAGIPIIAITGYFNWRRSKMEEEVAI
ncbi:MAG: TRAP transporter permease [Clostridia bacterium]|jgi:TRAP transporter 4TM/12TM fusion protein